MKNLLFSMCFIALLASCSKDAPLNEQITTEPIVESEAVSTLLKMEMNTTMYEEIHAYVGQSLKFGLDEEVRFIDILNKDSTSKMAIRNKATELFKKELERVTSQSLTRAGTSSATVFDNSEIQIYWPYSEYWDGVTEPVITFAPTDEDQDWNYGYKKIKNEDGSYSIKEVIVNEEYAINNPVWIINNNERLYETLPDFSKGEYVKNNVIFAQPSTSEIENTKTSTRAIGDKIYTITLGKFRALIQFDSWFFGGGSEFQFQYGHVDNFNIKDENGIYELTDSSFNVTTITVTRSRKNIKNKEWAIIGLPLDPEWLPNELNIGFMVHEEDGGKRTTWNPKISVTYKGVTLGADVSIPYGAKDKVIYQAVLTKNYIFSTGNRGRTYSNGGIEWTMPYEENEVLID